MRRLVLIVAVLLPLCSGALSAASSQAGATVVPNRVTLAATSPGGPFVSGIAGQGYYAGFSTVTAHNGSAVSSSWKWFTVRIPLDTGTAQFAVTSDVGSRRCSVRTGASAQIWTCAIPPMAAGASRVVATIVGSEDAATGLPTTVATEVVGPGRASIPLTWRWVLPYSHLTASWSNLPSGADWGSAVGATLTVTNDGIWTTSGVPTVTIAPSDPAAYNGGWTGSLVGGYPQYCGVDRSTRANGDGLSCPLDPIGPGRSETIQVTAYPVAPAGGPFTMVASDSTGDFTLASPAVAVTGTGAQLSLSVSNPPTVEGGTAFDRTYTVTNAGSTEALAVTISDMASAFLVGGTTGPGTCAYHSAYRVGGRIDCSFGTIPANTSATLVASLQAPPISGSAVDYTNVAYGTTSSPYVASGAYMSANVGVTVYNNPVVNLTAPTLTGTPRVGQVLTATWGSWGGTGPLILWAKLCHSNGGGCSGDIPSTYTNGTTTSGAPSSTAFTYPVPAGDAGTELVLAVYAQNYDGMISVTTSPVGAVAP